MCLARLGFPNDRPILELEDLLFLFLDYEVLGHQYASLAIRPESVIRSVRIDRLGVWPHPLEFIFRVAGVDDSPKRVGTGRILMKRVNLDGASI